jgi:hypothetical protein
MLKRIALAALITSAAFAVYGQTTQSDPQQAASAPPATATGTPASAASADIRKLIGRSLQNPQNETIGEIRSIYIGKDGKVDSVMAAVGGFLGLGKREVRLAWKDLIISDNGEKVMVNMSKDELAAMPEYKYGDPSWRGQVFSDAGPWKPDESQRSAEMAASQPASPAPNTAAAPAMPSGAFNGQASSRAIIGATVKNDAKETVGKIEEVYVERDGTIKTVIISVGGFLGIGAKNVAVQWSELKVARDGGDLVFIATMTKDSLKAMPDYQRDRSAPTTR